MRTVIVSVAACIALSAWCAGVVRPAVARGTSKSGAAPDNAELKRLHDEDQADRAPDTIDWSVVGPRDRARQGRVKEMLAGNALHTANDYYHAALILQHGDVPEDFLLAHELCVVAILKGRNDRETAWLAASAEDRYLMNIDRPQRFGTQFRSENNGPVRLYKVDESVTDELRRLMGVHSLAEARAHEAEINRPGGTR